MKSVLTHFKYEVVNKNIRPIIITGEKIKEFLCIVEHNVPKWFELEFNFPAQSSSCLAAAGTARCERSSACKHHPPLPQSLSMDFLIESITEKKHLERPGEKMDAGALRRRGAIILLLVAVAS